MKRLCLALLAATALSACLSEAELETDSQDQVEAAPAAEALTLCDPLYRYHSWFATFNKLAFNQCTEGPYIRADGSWAQAVFCSYLGQGGTLIYRGLGIQRPGRNQVNTLSFDNYACEFQSCDVYRSSMTCNCSYCTTTGFEPAPR